VHKAPPPPDRSKWQRALNEHWPFVDSKGQRHARGVPDQKNPIPVRVRVVWQRDGEQWIEEAMARRWTKTAVFVTFDDERLQISGVWVAPADVQRC
jgi:hypothetical protein